MRTSAQADLAFVEARYNLDVGTRAKLACQLVSPGVIGADQHLAVAFARDQLMRAVLADIVESADDAVAAADAEQALAGDLEGEIVAGFSTWLACRRTARCATAARPPLGLKIAGSV
jgi:hypothetical protein